MTLGTKIYTIVIKYLGGKGIGMLPIVRNINKMVTTKLVSDHTTVDGHKMFLDAGDTLSLSIMGTFEERERVI